VAVAGGEIRIIIDFLKNQFVDYFVQQYLPQLLPQVLSGWKIMFSSTCIELINSRTDKEFTRKIFIAFRFSQELLFYNIVNHRTG
jgi:hypothetical protein